MDEELRQWIVSEAKTWLRTPYHHQGRIKGAGVDCAQFLVDVYFQCGLIPDLHITDYPHDWHLHRDEEKYLSWVEKYAHEIDLPIVQPGDICLYQFGRVISHGVIVVKWPIVIHSYINVGVETTDATKHPLAGRLRKVYSL